MRLILYVCKQCVDKIQLKVSDDVRVWAIVAQNISPILGGWMEYFYSQIIWTSLVEVECPVNFSMSNLMVENYGKLKARHDGWRF